MRIGQGGFSNVYIHIDHGKQYACKKIPLPIKFDVSHLVSEINAFRLTKHPNIVKCFGFRISSFRSFDILFEYVKGKTLDVGYGKKDEEQLFYWIYQLALALLHLKQQGIVHKDIKPSNILVSQDGVIKIVDFGVSQMLCTHYSQIQGTYCYIAPEILQRNEVNIKSDIWSLGITLYQLTHGTLPYPKKRFKQNGCVQYYQDIDFEEIQVSRDHCSQEMANLIERMLDVNPQTRISPIEIFRHQAIRRRQNQLHNRYMMDIENHY